MNHRAHGPAMKIKHEGLSSQASLMPQKNIIFVLPEETNRPTGGNIFNRFFLDALKEEGVSFSQMSFEKAAPLIERRADASFWIDTLCLDPLVNHLETKPRKSHVFLLIHYLPSLVLGKNTEERERWLAKEQQVLDSLSGALVTSSYMRDILKKRKFKKKIWVIPPALCVRPSGKKPDISGFKSLMVSNLVEEKGMWEFLTELAEWIKESDRFCIDIVGRDDLDPTYAQACKKLIERNPLLKKHIRFLGPVPIEDMESLYSSHSVFISASKFEAYGMAVQEASAFGLPILAYDGGSVRKHIRVGKNGYVFSSFRGLASACVEWMRNPEKLQKMKEKALKTKRDIDYTWKDAARIFINGLKY